MPVVSTEKPVRSAMESTSLQKIRERAEEYDKTLLATDPRFRRIVILEHEDGSYLQFDKAFLMRVGKEWIACFTEHHGVHVYHAEDLFAYSQFERVNTLEELP
jgi:hypothetical protein